MTAVARRLAAPLAVILLGLTAAAPALADVVPLPRPPSASHVERWVLLLGGVAIALFVALVVSVIVKIVRS